jgi:hypothetical protein
MQANPFVQRMVKLAREAVDAEAGRGSSEEVARGMLRVRTGLLATIAINAVLFAAIIVDMVVKPFE